MITKASKPFSPRHLRLRKTIFLTGVFLMFAVGIFVCWQWPDAVRGFPKKSVGWVNTLLARMEDGVALDVSPKALALNGAQRAWSPIHVPATPSEVAAFDALTKCVKNKNNAFWANEKETPEEERARLRPRYRTDRPPTQSPEEVILACEEQAIFWPEATPEMRAAVQRRRTLASTAP